jgi:hypothetical protein
VTGLFYQQVRYLRAGPAVHYSIDRPGAGRAHFFSARAIAPEIATGASYVPLPAR